MDTRTQLKHGSAVESREVFVLLCSNATPFTVTF